VYIDGGLCCPAFGMACASLPDLVPDLLGAHSHHHTVQLQMDREGLACLGLYLAGLRLCAPSMSTGATLRSSEPDKPHNIAWCRWTWP